LGKSQKKDAATTFHVSGIALYLVNCAAAPTCHDVDGSDLSQPIEELICGNGLVVALWTPIHLQITNHLVIPAQPSKLW
jgi:hypothetical protein